MPGAAATVVVTLERFVATPSGVLVRVISRRGDDTNLVPPRLVHSFEQLEALLQDVFAQAYAAVDLDP